MSDTWNYRPVAVATVVSKLLEQFILSNNISPFLGTTDDQYGFKANHSTDQCTFLLKQTASYFVTHGSSVHTVFLDASKAFDRVLHMKLFEKLIQRKVPMCFVRLLKHWYKEQTIQIKWGKHFSGPFHVSNGVRQGGVLSPYLFAVYLDDLSNELNNIKAGCYIGEALLNHLNACRWYLCVLSKRTLVAKNTRCVPGVCRIAWDYLQLQQNCLHDV